MDIEPPIPAEWHYSKALLLCDVCADRRDR
jgi:hypothetical protein